MVLCGIRETPFACKKCSARQDGKLMLIVRLDCTGGLENMEDLSAQSNPLNQQFEHEQIAGIECPTL